MIEALSLAWRQLARKKVRLIVALAGIAFADILMLMQVGFQDALFTSAVLLHRHLDADLVMIHPRYGYLMSTQSFSRRRLYQAIGYEGVESVAPLYIGLRGWKNPQTHETHPILVIGAEADRPGLDLAEVQAGRTSLRQADTVLFDIASLPKFGPIAQTVAGGLPALVEMDGHRVRVGGLFRLGTTFMADGNIVTSDLNFLRLFPTRRQGVIDVGLIKLKAGTNEGRVRRALADRLGGEVRILTRDEFAALERTFWDVNSPIGYIFSLGVLMGFIVGVVIVYQILYSDVADHLPEYATLKAMGYADVFLFAVVGYEAFLLAGLGYVPGLLVSRALYHVTEQATGLPMALTLDRAATTLLGTIVMCGLSGVIALRRIRTADPAEIF